MSSIRIPSTRNRSGVRPILTKPSLLYYSIAPGLCPNTPRSNHSSVGSERHQDTTDLSSSRARPRRR